MRKSFAFTKTISNYLTHSQLFFIKAHRQTRFIKQIRKKVVNAKLPYSWVCLLQPFYLSGKVKSFMLL